jgi:GNAT superfamily N-acetyltransferase
MNRLEIRAYRNEDLPLLEDLVYQLHEQLRRFDAYLPPANEIIDGYVVYLLGTSTATSGTFFVAEADDRIVGYLCLFGLVSPPEPDQYPDKYAAVADIYVLPEYQDRGIGGALMQSAEDCSPRCYWRTPVNSVSPIMVL